MHASKPMTRGWQDYWEWNDKPTKECGAVKDVLEAAKVKFWQAIVKRPRAYARDSNRAHARASLERGEKSLKRLTTPITRAAGRSK